MRRLAMILGLLLTGCGGAAPTADPVDLMASVTRDGQPVTDVELNFQPTGLGLPRVIKLKGDGQFLTTMIPGTYTYYFTPGSSKAAFEKIPKAYRTASMERQIEITGHQEPLELVLQ